MYFSDKEIAKWKNEIDKYDGQGVFRIYGAEMLALLARLEAAKDYINALSTGNGIKTVSLFRQKWEASKRDRTEMK